MPSLPAAPTRAEIVAFLDAPDRWAPAMRAIAGRHGLPTSDLQPLPVGSNVVFAAGPAVVKLAPPSWAREVRAEAALLAAVEGRLAVPTPALLAVGELDGWPYVVMQRMPGRPARSVFRTLAAGDQARLLTTLGAGLAGIHRLEVPVLADLPPTFDDVVGTDLAALAAKQRARGFPPAWVDEAHARVARVLPALAAAPRVASHADLTWDNVLVSDVGGTWHVTALLDFADAIVAPVVYDLATPAAHWTTGRPDLWRAFLAGVGRIDPPPGLALEDALLACVWVHRFLEPERMRADFCPPPGPATLDDLVAALCPSSPVP